MKRKLKEPGRDESGQALLLVVILLLVGTLIVVSLLGFMGTGLIAGQVFEKRMNEVYAADAGIEDAIWKIKNGLVPDEGIVYDLTVNRKDVHVIIPPEPGDAMLSFFINLGILRDTQGNYNKARPHQEWLVVYNPIESDEEDGMVYEYRITGLYAADGQPRLSSTGFWILGYDKADGKTSVIEWDSAKDGILGIDLNNDTIIGDDWIDIDGDGVDDVQENDIITQPLIDQGYTNYEDDDDDGVSDIVDLFGRTFIWEWQNQGPTFGPGVIARTQRFILDPPIPFEDFPINVAWIGTAQNSIQISWLGEVLSMEGIVAIATDPDTGKSTTVTSYLFAESMPEEPVAITILTWEVDLQ